MPRACESLSSVRLLDPVHGGSHAEYTHEGASGLLIAGRNRAPLLEPGPEALDAVAVDVDPRRTGDGRLVALGRDRRACAEAPDEGGGGGAGGAGGGQDPGGGGGEGRRGEGGQGGFG